MSTQTRLFVGNLPNNTSENTLRSAFSVYGEIVNIDIKYKSNDEKEQKKFAFVTLSGSNYDIESCIKRFSNEEFNGNQLYVTRARESFLERLQREREQAKQKEAEKNDCKQEIPVKNPVIKLSDKLNPRKRKQDPQSNNKDAYQNKSDNLFEKNNSFGNHNTVEKTIEPTEKDKIKIDSDKKRMDSIKKKRQEFKQKQMIIKTGLIGIDKVKNKKIIFSEEEGDTEQNDSIMNDSSKVTIKKNNLFDDDESDGELNFEIKQHYEGQKGQKVLDLQSRYKSDKRFTLDERFAEEDHSEEEKDKEQILNDEEDEIALEQTDEREKQLNILQDVLGIAIKPHGSHPKETKDAKKKSKLGMLRFDPAQPDHVKFLAPVANIKQEKKLKKKDKTKEVQEQESITENVETETRKVEVSKEQFYKVSETLKEAMAQPTTFSLRSLFSKADEDNDKDAEPRQQDVDYIPLAAPKDKKVKNPLDPGEKNPFVYDSSDSEDEVLDKEAKPETIKETSEVKPVWKENLFFTDLDNRLIEGLNFFNKTSEVGCQKERRELKMLMKKRIYNKERKNQMFQKKIGGRKKTPKKSYRKKS